jgi:hypothetical protein
MATLTVQSITRSGLKPSYVVASGTGDQFSNAGKAFLHVKNADTVAHTVTVASQVAQPPPGTAAADIAVTVPAGEDRMIGPFPPNAFNDADKFVQATYDAVTGVTVAAIV